jgi:DNA-binding response OmpR family regulator
MSKSLLIVEDHAGTGRGLKLYLELLGYTVTVADSIKTARKFARKMNFDLLISDLNLPDGTGWDFLKWLSKKRPIRAIAISGWGRQEDVARSKEAGFFSHLVKPIIPEELVEAIQRTLAFHEPLSRARTISIAGKRISDSALGGS